MSKPRQPSLFDDRAAAALSPDEEARRFAVDPRHHVVLEASAGTGKTSVLVQRYINLLRAGVDPANILAITFTRKAAAEMRERIVRELREAAARSEIEKKQWLELRNRLGEIAISTIDAFCLSLLREFPLEADLDPAFDMADETEVPRLVEESLDRSLRIFLSRAGSDPDIALVLAQLGVSRTRQGLAALLDRRLVAWDALNRFLVRGPSDLTSAEVCRRAAVALNDTLRTIPGGMTRFLADGPSGHPRYEMFLRALERLPDLESQADATIRAVLERVASHFLTEKGQPRKSSGAIHPYNAGHYPTPDASKRHRAAVAEVGERVRDVLTAFNRDLNVVLARGVKRMFAIALEQYRRALDERSVLDFSDVLQRALHLLRQMDEFSQSRYRLEWRYHHVLVDEFQDTSRAQWELISLLIQAWGEGAGLAAEPSIFVVGDRKQSIYRFRDAEVAVLEDAGRYIDALRTEGGSRRAISRSFRAVPELLAFVNDVFGAVAQPSGRADDFTYGESDRFPVDLTAETRRGAVLGIAVAEEPEQCAAAIAAEIARILDEDSVRDRKTGVARRARPGDIGILFRSRTSHREFERALAEYQIPSYVYKGLGFFDADEIKDLTALMRYFASPTSDLRAAAFMRSRFVGLSDPGLMALAPRLADALGNPDPPVAAAALSETDQRVLQQARAFVAENVGLVDRIPPADLIERMLPSTAYAYELRGPRRLQAWENLKKLRALVRRIQNRGYATLSRIADYIDALSAGDESNAVIEALDSVNLMTVHAAKGLEFPIVFVVNLARGASGPPKPIRVVADGPGGEPAVSIGPFVSDTDEAEREREKQETRRLLYVALTRARDRLYFASLLKEGVLAPGRGSLADVLPDSFKSVFTSAASGESSVTWVGPSEHPFDLRVCKVPDDGGVRAEARAGSAAQAAPFIVPPHATAGAARSSVSDWLARSEQERPQDNDDIHSLAGRLVHRLFECGPMIPSDPAARLDFASGLLHLQERTVDDADDAVRRAIRIWQELAERDDVRQVLDGACQYEVPFSLVDEGTSVVLRGTIDCLVHHRDGRLLVVDFKSGHRLPRHQWQLEIYVRAARALYPDRDVAGALIYAGA